jgi:acyl-CoA reductase-like NAD-dependent aldehyde dehydrogenase
MELGGKASAVVLDDADIETAAFQCALGAFLHSGQICMATERIVIQESIVDQFVPALQGAIKKISPDAGDAPVLIQPQGVEKNKKLISDAVSKGGKILHGDHEVDEKHPETQEISKTRMRPVVVGNVTKEMDLYDTESFGPSVSLIAVSTEDEAIKIANDTEYGLSGAIFTKDLARGLRVARQIESGAIHINSMSVHDETALPHGGAKKSGFGRFNGSWGIDEFLRIKTVTFQE